MNRSIYISVISYHHTNAVQKVSILIILFHISHKPLHNIVNATDIISTMSSTSISNQKHSISLSSSIVDTQAINYLFHQFNHLNSQSNQLYFFLNMFHPLHSDAHGIVWYALNHTNNFACNVTTMEDTHFFFKSYNLMPCYSSKHCVNLMELLQTTLNHSNINNKVPSQVPSHERDIYKMFMVSKHSIQTNLPAPTTFNIASTACILLQYIIPIYGVKQW